MLYEYLLEFRAYCYSDSNTLLYIGETRTCWGKDEYDVLTRHISKYLKRTELSPDELFLKLSRIRPTGRYQKYPYKRTVNFFECDVRPYIKGLINRFMVRFLVSDTEREIEFYKAQFEDFLDRYRDEFPDDIVRKIYNQYEKRLKKIKTGEVKPLSFELKRDKTKPFDPNRIIIEYSEQIAKILRMFGFRVKFSNGTYMVTKPIYYNRGIFNRDYKEFFKMTPIELILFWGDYYRNWAFESEIKYYNLDDNIDTVISFLGRAVNEKDKKEYENKLKKAGLTPFIFKDECEAYHFYILKEEEERAKDLLTSIKADLYGLDIEDFVPLYNRSSYSGRNRYCVFCGDRVADGDILCPTCANNID